MRILQMMQEKKVAQIAKELNLSRQTVYEVLRRA
jgi:predicted DNA binding protein